MILAEQKAELALRRSDKLCHRLEENLIDIKKSSGSGCCGIVIYLLLSCFCFFCIFFVFGEIASVEY